jgi:hypothetical protein
MWDEKPRQSTCIVNPRSLKSTKSPLSQVYWDSYNHGTTLGGGGENYTNDRVMKVRKSYLSLGPKWIIMSQGSWFCHIVDILVDGISIGCWFCHLPNQFVAYQIFKVSEWTLWSWFCQTHRRVLCMCAWQNQPHKPSSLTY